MSLTLALQVLLVPSYGNVVGIREAAIQLYFSSTVFFDVLEVMLCVSCLRVLVLY